MTQRALVAIVLAGGHSERLGGTDKAMAEIAGSTLLDHVLAAVPRAAQTIVVGPQRATVHSVTWCQEDPVGSGPVAAFAAGLQACPSAETVLLLGVDLPFIADAIPILVEALTSATDVAVLCDGAGRANYLASIWWRSVVQERLSELGDPSGLSMRRLLDGLHVTEVADTGGWGFDCDTWEALEAARRRGSEDDR